MDPDGISRTICRDARALVRPAGRKPCKRLPEHRQLSEYEFGIYGAGLRRRGEGETGDKRQTFFSSLPFSPSPLLLSPVSYLRVSEAIASANSSISTGFA